MIKERILIGLIAIVLGITLTAGGFYLWQATKVIPKPQITTQSQNDPSSGATAEPSLSIENPIDESVVDKRIIQVKGIATKSHTIIVSTPTQDLILKPASDGSFTTNVTLSEGVNHIEVLALLRDGDTASLARAVTFTTEAF